MHETLNIDTLDTWPTKESFIHQRQHFVEQRRPQTIQLFIKMGNDAETASHMAEMTLRTQFVYFFLDEQLHLQSKLAHKFTWLTGMGGINHALTNFSFSVNGNQDNSLSSSQLLELAKDDRNQFTITDMVIGISLDHIQHLAMSIRTHSMDQTEIDRTLANNSLEFEEAVVEEVYHFLDAISVVGSRDKLLRFLTEMIDYEVPQPPKNWLLPTPEEKAVHDKYQKKQIEIRAQKFAVEFKEKYLL